MNAEIALLYVKAWLSGSGCVPIHNLMEDAATAEISRSQLFQWVRHAVQTEDGRKVTAERVRVVIDEVAKALGPGFDKAAQYLKGMVQTCPEFITTTCYHEICESKMSWVSKL